MIVLDIIFIKLKSWYLKYWDEWNSQFVSSILVGLFPYLNYLSIKKVLDLKYNLRTFSGTEWEDFEELIVGFLFPILTNLYYRNPKYNQIKKKLSLNSKSMQIILFILGFGYIIFTVFSFIILALI